MAMTWVFILTTLLLHGKLTTQTCLTDDVKCSRFSLTRGGLLKEVKCASSSTTACETAVDGIADSTNAHQWMGTSTSTVDLYYGIHFNGVFRINKIRLKQLGSDFKQIRDLDLEFEGTVNPIVLSDTVQLGIQGSKWQTFRFSDVNTKYVILKPKTFYSVDSLAYGFQEVEVFNENCGKNQLCESTTISDQDSSPYPLHSGAATFYVKFDNTSLTEYTVYLYFVAKLPKGDTSKRMKVALHFKSSTIDIVLTSNTNDVTKTLNVPAKADQKYVFFADFSSGNKFHFGLGLKATFMASVDWVSSEISHVTFEHVAGVFHVDICNKRRSCNAGAENHWPMDTFNGVDIVDHAGYSYGIINGGEVSSGPPINPGFTTSAIKLNSKTNDYLDLGDFSGSHMISPFHWTQGWTFQFWLRLSFSDHTHNTLISIPDYFTVKLSTGIGLKVSYILNSSKYTVCNTTELQLMVWYHITITWDSLDKLTVYHNQVGKFSSVWQEYTGTRGMDSNLYIGCSTLRGVVCPTITVADVSYWNKRLSEEEVTKNALCAGYKLSMPDSLGVSRGTIPDTSLTSSSEKNTIYGLHASDLARPGLHSSGPESWMPSILDNAPFLQVDLNYVVKVNEVGVQGDKREDKWVTGYTLRYKQHVSPWEFVDYTTKHTTKGWSYSGCGPRVIINTTEASADATPTVLDGPTDNTMMVSNILPSQVVTSSLRFFPKSWVGGIAMRIEVFSSSLAENYKGCFSKGTSFVHSGEYDGSNMTPATCIQVCRQLSKSYAFVRAGSLCFCDNTLPTTPSNVIIDETLCSIPCTGNPGLQCGGDLYDAVYQVVGTASTPSLTLTLPSTVNIFTNFTITVSPLPESFYVVEFGNGMVLKSANPVMHFSLPSPGTYNIKASAMTSQNGQPELVLDEKSMDVAVELSVKFECEPAVETLQTFECILDILQTSDYNFEIDFFDGKSTITDTIKETTQVVLGYDVNDWSSSTSSQGLYMLHTLTFENTGVIQGYEVLATKAGILRLLVIRPLCLFNTSESYIKADGSAVTAPKCTSSSNTTSSEMLCVTQGAAADSTAFCMRPTSANTPNTLATKHEIVHEYIAHVHAGLNLLHFDTLQLPSQPHVAYGYQFGFSIPAENGAEIAEALTGGEAWYYFADELSPIGTILEESFGTLRYGERFHVKAFYTVNTVQVFTQSYNNIGFFHPEVRFLVGGTTVKYTSGIAVCEPIEGGNWTLSTTNYIATNATLSMEIHALTRGHNITVNIIYESDDTTDFFEERINDAINIDHIYRTRGMKPLSMTYTNPLSALEFGCSIHVQDIVQILELFEPIAPVPTGSVSEITWYLLHGSDVWFEFDLGDGTFYKNGTFDVDGILAVYATNIYFSPGEYDVNITIYNDVSSITLMTLAVVEDPIVNMTVEVEHAARDIEVNEEIAFNISMVNGTSPLYLIDFGDGTSIYSWSSVIFHTYTSWAIYDVNITVWNNVSIANISLQVKVHKPVYPLIDFVVTAPPTNLTDPSPFMLNITNGTDYNCTWDFGDGQMGENDYDDLGTNLYHTYGAVDVYTVFVNCTNRLYAINFTFVAIVQEPILDFVFPEIPPLLYTIDLTFDWSLTGTNATYNITYQNKYIDVSSLFLQNPDLALLPNRTAGSYTIQAPTDVTPASHTPGIYLVEITVWNLVTPPKSILHEVIIDQPIENPVLHADEEYWEVNKTVIMTTTVTLGTNITLSFDFGDGQTYEEFLIGEISGVNVNTTHVFEDDGMFNVKLLISNSVSNFTLTLQLQLQHVPDLTLTSNSPQISPGAVVHFSLVVNPGKVPPTNATSTWHFGDGSSLTKPFAFNETHAYSTHGWYIVSVVITNEVSTTNITGYADVQRVIVSPEVWVVNTAGDKGDGVQGAGPSGNTFPSEHPLRFMTSVEDGTNITYKYQFGNDGSGSTNETSYEHLFSNSGSFVVDVVVENSVSVVLLTVEIITQHSVKDVKIVNDGPIVYNTPMSFSLTIGQIGDQSCFYVDLKNGSKITFQPESTTACTTQPSFSTDVRTFSGNVVNFTHIYQYEGEFIVSVEGQNDGSLILAEERAVSVDKPCFYPKAVVIECGKNVTSARQFIKSKDIIIPTENKIDCEAALYSKFFWKVGIYEPDKPYIPEGENETTVFYPTANVSGVTYDAPKLVVKARALDYGIYRAIENVSMVGPAGVWDEDEGYFEIIKSPVNADIAGGNKRSIGYGKNITLDAVKSGDPDVEEGDRTGIVVYWLCKRTSDDFVFPDDPSNLTMLSMIPRNVSLNSTNATDLGGCFGHGPGLFNFTGFVLNIGTDHMTINEQYDFRIFIRKDNRTAFYDSSVVVVPGDPPELAINCMRNCLGKFNPSEKITLKTECLSCTPTSIKKLVYSWKLHYEEGEENWVEVDLAAIAKSKLTSDILVIGGMSLDGGKRYRIRVEAGFQGGYPGFSELAKIVNMPPFGGTCTCTPDEGFAMDEAFTINCIDWQDVDLPLKYKFSYKNGDGLISGIYEGLDNIRTRMRMPLGKPEFDRNVTVIFGVMDSFDAVTLVQATIKVKEPEMSDEELADMTAKMTSPSGELGNLIAEGNAQATVQFVGALTSLLNSKVEPEVVATQAPTTEKPGPPKSPAELAKLEEERLRKEAEAKKKAEEEMKQRIAARDAMIGAVSSLQIDKVTTVQQTSAALQSLLSTPAEVSPNAQSAASNAMANMASFMLSNSGSTSPSQMEAAATGMVSGLGSIISASSSTVGKSSDNATGVGVIPRNESAALAKAVTAAYESAVNNLFLALSAMSVVGEDAVEIASPAMSLATVKKLPSDLAGYGLKAGSGGFGMPESDGNDTDQEPVDMKGVSLKDNCYSWDDSASSVNSDVMTMEIRNASGHIIPVKNLSKPISIFASTGQPPGTPVNTSARHQQMIFLKLDIVKNDTSIHFVIAPEYANTELLVFLKRGGRPTRFDYEFSQVIPDEPPVNATYPKDRHAFYVSNEDTNRTTSGTWYLGIYYNGTIVPEYKKIVGKEEMELHVPNVANFSVLMFSSGCQFWDGVCQIWKGDGCVVGPQTKMEKVQCLCTHLTSFAGDFFVMPNAIDWSKISLDNLFSNPTVFAVVMAIFGLYVIAMIWARKKDKRDLEEIGATPLPDNDPRDTYLYEVAFFTGHSASSGTTAKVYVILEGTVDETSPRAMRDPVRTKFKKSAVDTFLLAVPSSLGRLKTLKIWHDNSGESPGWFLQRVLVLDTQTDKKTWFLCDKWLDVAEDDGNIERELEPATRDDLTSFNLLFSTEARKSLTDSHLWFSVFKRPPRSTFTRCQRLSCCLTIILTTMLANAMFFQTDSTSSTGTEIRLGPISFSVKQISIAITSSMVVLPANILIVTLFRKAAPKQQKQISDPNKKSDNYAAENDEEDGNDKEDDNDKKNKQKEKKKDKKKKKDKEEKQKEEVIKVEDEKKEKKKKRKKGQYPHWVIYVAYVVVFFASLVSATFTVFYGLTFGAAKSQKWIMTMMISFWQDVLISQPLKVFAAATFFALVIKNPDKVTDEEEHKKEGSELKSDEEKLHNNERTEEDEMAEIKKKALMPKPPDPVKLEEMRRFKLKQKVMYKIIREILSYMVFVCILLTVAYGNRDYKSHHVNNALTSYFMSGTYAGKMALGDISDINGFYKYLRKSLLPTLKPDFWYGPYDGSVSKVKDVNKGEIFAVSSPGFNGTTIYHQVHPYPNGYTADRANTWLVGTPRIRQLRVTDKGCIFPKGVDHLVARCSKPYSFDNEDEGYYEPGWIPMNKSKIELIRNDKWFKSPWSYKTGWQLKGTPYWGFFNTYWSGGFVAELGASYEAAVNMSIELERLNWLDGKTRAVFFEFTIYNPFTNFFAVANILVEILPTGGYYPYPYIATTRLYRYVGAEAMVIMALEVVFFIYLIYYIVREVKELRSLGKRAYFRDLWNYFDILVIISSVATIVFYFMRMAATTIVIRRYLEDPYTFVNFNYVIALDTMVTTFMSLAVFVSFLKFLRLLRFNSRIGMLASVIKACIAPLASFFLLFMIIFLAYTQFAFLIFGPKMFDYSSFDQCLANMLGMTLGAFDFDSLVSTNRILGPIFFFSYIMVMVMILMNVFLTIINDTFNEVNADESLQSNDSDIADFMMTRLVATIKRTGKNVTPIYKEPKDKLGQSLDDIEDISENVTLVMRNMCLESIRHTSWFKSENSEESDKKRQILELLLLSGENLTENEVCDAIPVLDTVLAKYSSAELKHITLRFQEKLAREEKEDIEEQEGMKEGIDSEDENSGNSEDSGDDSDGSDGNDNGGEDDPENDGGPRTEIKFDF